jgi:hypothetical protein
MVFVGSFACSTAFAGVAGVAAAAGVAGVAFVGSAAFGAAGVAGVAFVAGVAGAAAFGACANAAPLNASATAIAMMFFIVGCSFFNVSGLLQGD